MGRWAWDAVMLALCAAWLLALAVIVTGPSGGVVLFLKDQATAAWVQAIGSIGAIVFAWWQGQRVQYLESRRKKDEALRFLGYLLGVSHSLATTIANFEKVLKQQEKDGVAVGSVRLLDHERTVGALLRMPIKEWPSPSLAAELEGIHGPLREVRELMPNALKAVARGMWQADAVTAITDETAEVRFRLRGFNNQIAFYKAINEEGPGPIITFRRADRASGG